MSLISADAPQAKRYKKKSQLRDVWIRMKRNKSAMVGLVVFAGLILLALFADVIADYEEVVIMPNYEEALEGPSARHWMGTDDMGRDVFARMVHGARVSLKVGLMAVVIACFVGSALGAVSGYYGGWVDNVIMRFMDVLLAVPDIFLSITIVAALGTSMYNLMLAIGVSSIPGYARQIRASVMSIKDQEFVEAAKSVGARNTIIIVEEIIPNCIAPLIVKTTMGIAGGILSVSALSFLGLGVQAPAPEWGAMLSEGRKYMMHASHLTLFPGLAILITVLSLNFLGDGLRDALDPRLKQ